MAEPISAVMGRDSVPAPWTLEQVSAIERWQGCKTVHPLTCPNHGSRQLLVTPDALLCPRCDYRQTSVPAVVLTTLDNRRL